MIVDTAGSDTITFAQGISKDDLIIKTNGADISIYLKDGSKPLSELSDQIIIKDWHTISTLKTVTFSDGTSLNAHDIVAMFATDKNDTINAGSGNDTLLFITNNNILWNNKKYIPLHIFTNPLNNIDLSHNKILNLKEVGNIKKCFYLFSNDIWDVDIKNRNLLNEVA